MASLVVVCARVGKWIINLNVGPGGNFGDCLAKEAEERKMEEEHVATPVVEDPGKRPRGEHRRCRSHQRKLVDFHFRRIFVCFVHIQGITQA